MKIQLKRERDQLLHTWARYFKHHDNWFTNEFTQINKIIYLSKTDPELYFTIGSQIRQFHDKLGFMAKGDLADGGLCSGVIFRTTNFINLENRCGARGANKNIHVEHTVPITVLEKQLNCMRDFNYFQLLSWLLKYSVVTAFEQNQQSLLNGVQRSSDIFYDNSTDFHKPFKRYRKLFDSGETIWNVFDGTQVKPELFTPQHNFEIIMNIMRETGANIKMIQEFEIIYS